MKKIILTLFIILCPILAYAHQAGNMQNGGGKLR